MADSDRLQVRHHQSHASLRRLILLVFLPDANVPRPTRQGPPERSLRCKSTLALRESRKRQTSETRSHCHLVVVVTSECHGICVVFRPVQPKLTCRCFIGSPARLRQAAGTGGYLSALHTAGPQSTGPAAAVQYCIYGTTTITGNVLYLAPRPAKDDVRAIWAFFARSSHARPEDPPRPSRPLSVLRSALRLRAFANGSITTNSSSAFLR